MEPPKGNEPNLRKEVTTPIAIAIPEKTNCLVEILVLFFFEPKKLPMSKRAIKNKIKTRYPNGCRIT